MPPGAFARFEHPALHPSRAASVELGGRIVGLVGEPHPRWVQQYDPPAAPVVFELDLAAISSYPAAAGGEPSRFQPVRRDIAVLVDESIGVQTLLDAQL